MDREKSNASGEGAVSGGAAGGLCQRLSAANDFMVCPVDPQCRNNADASSWFTYLGRTWDFCTTGDPGNGMGGGIS